MKQLAFLLLSVLMLLAVTACHEKKTAPKTQPIENTQNSLTEETSDERTDTGMKMYINDTEIPVIWENNPSVSALRSDLQAGDIVVSMTMYSNNEQVGPLDKSYPSNDVQMTTNNGDIVLYRSDQIVLFYGSNSWAYTRLGKMDLSENEVINLLSNGDVSIRLTL